MNLKQKLQFIRANHPLFFEKLKKKFHAISEDDWKPSDKDIVEYNEMLQKHCENFSTELYNMLKL